MQKIPTLFERDWNGDRSRVLPQVHSGCEWVVAGEGVATRKLDGTCCKISEGRLYKRRELRESDAAPPDFEAVERDEETGKTVGWVPVGVGPEDKFHREALEHLRAARQQWSDVESLLPDGTYELVGPKIQGNPEHWPSHSLIPHSDMLLNLAEVPRTYAGLLDWCKGKDIEGVVFHHRDGRMAKIKLRDFGIKRHYEKAG